MRNAKKGRPIRNPSPINAPMIFGHLAMGLELLDAPLTCVTILVCGEEDAVGVGRWVEKVEVDEGFGRGLMVCVDTLEAN
jgi:hypothetical protein